MSETDAEGVDLFSEEVREKVLEPFIQATRTALREMANTEVVVRPLCQNTPNDACSMISARLPLLFATEGTLVLDFPARTAVALSRQILAGVSADVDEQLTRDCVGEITNVIAGQAKALLAGTPHRFSFSVPTVTVGVTDWQPTPGLDCLVIAFDGDRGAFVLRLYLAIESRRSQDKAPE